MIYDKFENMGLYCKKGDALYKAISYARDFDCLLPDKEHEVEERNIFAKVASYKTSPAEERKFEAHREYIDVQVILEGEERMDVSLEREETLKPLSGYDPNDDVIKLKAPSTYSSIAMKPGMFVVFFPQDVHRPNCSLDGETENRKVCMKVHI